MYVFSTVAMVTTALHQHWVPSCHIRHQLVAGWGGNKNYSHGMNQKLLCALGHQTTSLCCCMSPYLNVI